MLEEQYQKEMRRAQGISEESEGHLHIQGGSSYESYLKNADNMMKF